MVNTLDQDWRYLRVVFPLYTKATRGTKLVTVSQSCTEKLKNITEEGKHTTSDLLPKELHGPIHEVTKIQG